MMRQVRKILVSSQILGFASVVAALRKAFQSKKAGASETWGTQVTNRLLRSGISELF